MRCSALLIALFATILISVLPASVIAQELEDPWTDIVLPLPNIDIAETEYPLEEPDPEVEAETALARSQRFTVPKRPFVRSRPFLRTSAALIGSAGAFAYAQSRGGGDPDELMVPIAAGVIGGSIGGLIFTNAHPLKVVVGSALATLPAGALATFLAGITPDDQQAEIPLIAFSIPHGLLTSAFAQNR